MSCEEKEAWQSNQRELQRSHYAKNKDKINADNAAWRKMNRDKVIEIKSRWQKLNRNKINRTKSKYRKNQRQQKASDQFFILAVAAEQLSKLETTQ